MDNKIIGILVFMLLTAIVIPTNGMINTNTSQEKVENYDYLFKNDAIISPYTEKTCVNLGPNQSNDDLSEYMIGTIAVGIIFLESDGSIDPSTEDWAQVEKDDALGAFGIGGGYIYWCNWFGAQGMNYHTLMVYGEVNTVTISYEPITHPSAITNDYWEKLYVSEAMAKLGYSNGDWKKRVKDYSNHLRDTIETLPGVYGTDWAFTVFLVDNSNDADRLFSDGNHAYAYLGGPFTVCPYLRPGGPPGPMLYNVFAHEMGHIFYATDEYDSSPEYSGYLNAQDITGSSCIMDNLALCVSSGTKLQVGWKDSDFDGKADILDTEPETTLTPYSPDPTHDTTPTYHGSATVVATPNNNPYGPGNDVTTNFITGVEFRVDGGSWSYNVLSDDGNWDEAVEAFTFTTPTLSIGNHVIEARATNSVVNIDSTPASDTIGVKEKNKAIKTPFMQFLKNFLQSHPDILPVLKYLLGQ